MTNDYIRKADAKDALREKVFHNLTDEFYGAMQVLDELEPDDVAPVVHAKWERYSGITIRCSRCDYVIHDWRLSECKYCPNCGAKMDGQGEEL